MFVTDGARKQLMKDERQRFLDKAWPDVVATINRLGLNTDTLLKAASDGQKKGDKND